MAKSAKFTPDSKGMGQLARSAGVGRAAVAAANRGKAHAERIAPVGATGEYASSFEVEQAEVDVQTRNGVEKRAGAILRNTAPHAVYVEASNHVLKRTTDAIENGA